MKSSVLIVDDSLTVRMDLDAAFRAAGFAPILCASAAAAREVLSRSRLDLVVLDVILPDADGVEFLKEIKSASATSNPPVILLSTEAEVRDRVRGLKTGADEYVGKPYDTAYVVGRARELMMLQEAQGGEAGAPASVLIIDDSATFRETLKASLADNGYLVTTAASGEEGLQAAISLRPRAVILDSILPGIDGATVLRRMRQDATLRQTPCLLLTGSEDPGGELRALDAGADVYVRKEEPMGVILARLAAILRFSGGPSPATRSPSFLGPKKVLAVDDSLTYLQELAACLREEGYDPVLARSGEEALELLAVQQVDCILLDLVMPGLSGHETCRRVKASPAWRDIPLMMLTAREEREAMIEGINAGADDYIAKSSDFEVLKARLRAQLRRKQFEDENRHIRELLLQKELEAAQTRAALELAETRAALLADLERKNQELEAFSYSVSHDLKAPLRAIGGFSQVLLENHSEKLNEDGKQALSAIVKNTWKMDQLIGALLRFALMGRAAMQLSRVDMTSLAQSLLTEVLATCPERRIEVTVGDLPEAHGDPTLLGEVFGNLIGNAIKYTRYRDAARIEISGRIEARECVYLVKDNGAGFDMQYAGKLFGVFQRLHSSEQFEGTGVGLALVQRIVQRHGGRIWAEGSVDNGAAFHFTLPHLESEGVRKGLGERDQDAVLRVQS